MRTPLRPGTARSICRPPHGRVHILWQPPAPALWRPGRGPSWLRLQRAKAHPCYCNKLACRQTGTRRSGAVLVRGAVLQGAEGKGGCRQRGVLQHCRPAPPRPVTVAVTGGAHDSRRRGCSGVQPGAAGDTRTYKTQQQVASWHCNHTHQYRYRIIQSKHGDPRCCDLRAQPVEQQRPTPRLKLWKQHISGAGVRGHSPGALRTPQRHAISAARTRPANQLVARTQRHQPWQRARSSPRPSGCASHPKRS